MPIINTADVLIIGLGAVGSAALYQAAKRGAHVIGIDRFDPPHDFGSSHGETRITRQAIGEGREFVPLALRSHEIWEELEHATGRSLLVRNGCLVLASPRIPGSHHGSTSFLADTIATAREFGIAHEVLSADEVTQRFSQFQLRSDEEGYFEPGAGFVRPEACIEVQLDLAKRAGAQTCRNEMVEEIKATSTSVDVRTTRATYSAAKVILTAGAWIPKLLGADYAHLFHIYRQTLSWFAPNNVQQFASEKFPVFIWIAGSQPRDMIYGFPAIGEAGVKIGGEQYDSTVDPDMVPRGVSDTEIAAFYEEYIAPRFPGLSRRCLRSATCLYTVTPDAKFIVDQCAENISFASACSGHGFKHSAALGESLVTQALGEPPTIDLSMFRLQRFRR
jgi:sarcosine oxidase